MYGLTSKNSVGHILISDELNGLHFKGVAYLVNDPVVISDTFPVYGGSLEGAVKATFRIDNFRGYPVPFVRPAAQGTKYAVIHTDTSAGGIDTSVLENSWEFTVTWSGKDTSAIPRIYVFSELLGTLPTSTTAYANDHGLQLFSSTSECRYDSRVTPLGVYDAMPVIPPVYPAQDGLPSAETYKSKSRYQSWVSILDFNFSCASSYNVYPSANGIPSDSIMFSCPSAAQAVYTRSKRAYYTSDGGYGAKSQYHNRTRVWSVMYLQAYSVTSTSVVAGWNMYTAEYRNDTYVEGDGGFVGIGSTSTSQSSTGSIPYSQKTINRFTNTMIITDSRLYD